MFAVITWTRSLLAALLLLTVFVAPAVATPRSSSPLGRTTAVDRTQPTNRDSGEDQPPAGSPELGILLIIGIIGIFIFMVWLVSRVSDDSSPRGDGSII